MRPDWDTCLSVLCSDASKPERAKHAAEVERVLNVLTEALEEISAGEGHYGYQAFEYKQIARTALTQVKRDFAA